ncbi:MFS transporter [Fulvivirga maritima]|uniref:MFS transporter n=1 Tax=Fulvivirga maritima TaxID=2904247 RepID=UPI001F351517|nr:MFS transporter [Fulvivirga maritima]UII25383.1 MFS transporter [Fulvivirga maritima]
MAKANNQIFKSWVPNWLALVAIFLTLIPVATVLGIYLGGVSSAASYYGIDSTDVRYSVVVFYLAIASAFPLERKLFNRFSSKPYLVACSIIFVIINIILYYSRSFSLLLVFRFFGGMLSLGFIGIMFTLIFQQFHAQRSRILGYATLYGTLLGTAPLSQILDAFVFSKYDFNVIFLLKIYTLLPGIVLLFFLLRNDIDFRREGKGSLKSIDWKSFVLYASSFLLLAYIFLYGQYYQWFYSMRITLCCIAFVFIFTIYVVRQLRLKDPYIDLSVFKQRNFRIGMLLLIAFYFSKGDTSALYGFFANSVHLDVYYQSYVMIVNALGIVAGAALAARFILAKTRIRLVWLAGFGSLLVFHLLSLRVISNQAEIADILLPLFLLGFGNGILMLSIVIFYVTSVPENIAFSASVTGVAFRFATFTASMALVAFMGLRQQQIHYNSFGDDVTATNPLTMQRIQGYEQALTHGGATTLQSTQGARRLLGRAVANQSNLLYVRDYYIYMSIFIVIVMLAIAVTPHFHYHLRKIGTKLIPV